MVEWSIFNAVSYTHLPRIADAKVRLFLVFANILCTFLH